jgi:iron complex outermembrane receptor protein
MMDGIALNRAYDGTVSFGGFAPGDVERIEVVRGPFSSLYGGYAMGGVVNILIKMPGKREIVLKGSYGTDNTWSAYTSYGDMFRNKMSMFISYGYRSTDGYRTDYNVQSAKPTAGITGWSYTQSNTGAARYLIGDKGRNGSSEGNITAKMAYNFTKTSRLKLSFMRVENEYSYNDPDTYLINAAKVPVYTYGTVRESTFLAGNGGKVQNIYSAVYETEISNVKAKISLSRSEHEKNWYTSPGTTAPATRSGGPGTVSSTPSRTYDADLQFIMPLWNRHVFTYGGSYRYNWADTEENDLTCWRDEDSKANLTYQARGRDRTYALFLQDEIALRDNLTLYLGFRQDWWRAFDGYANDAGKAGYPQRYRSTDASSFSPKVAAVYSPFNRTILRFSAGESFRAPTLYDLYRTWTSSITGNTYAGNPDLKPETIRSWDIGAEQHLWKGGLIKATYFENYIDDLIYSRTVTATLQDKINVGRAEVKGVELEAEHLFESGLKVFANYTYNNSKVVNNSSKPETEGKQLALTAKEMFNMGADFARGPFAAKIIGRYVGKRYNNDLNNDRKNGVYTSYDPYFITDVKISYNIVTCATISLSVDNIFDRDYFSYYKSPDRKWYGGLTLKF